MRQDPRRTRRTGIRPPVRLPGVRKVRGWRADARGHSHGDSLHVVRTGRCDAGGSEELRAKDPRFGRPRRAAAEAGGAAAAGVNGIVCVCIWRGEMAAWWRLSCYHVWTETDWSVGWTTNFVIVLVHTI